MNLRLSNIYYFISVICVFFFLKFRYWKLQHGEAGEDHVVGSTTDSANKYAILEEMEEQDDR